MNTDKLKASALATAKAIVELVEWLPAGKKSATQLRRRALEARVTLLGAVADHLIENAQATSGPVLAYLVQYHDSNGGGQYLRFAKPPGDAVGIKSVTPLVAGKE